MASDQHMIKTLSDMLQDGETLLHSIFGYIKYNPYLLALQALFREDLNIH